MPPVVVRAKKKNPIGRRPPKTSRTQHSVATRKAFMTLVDAGVSLNKASKRLNLPLATASKIKKQAEASAAALGIDILDDRNFQNAPIGPRPHRFTKEEGDAICDYIASCSGERDLSTKEHIKKLNMQCSVTTVNKIMYERGYVREKKRGWKCLSKNGQRPMTTEPPTWICEKRNVEPDQLSLTPSITQNESIAHSAIGGESEDV